MFLPGTSSLVEQLDSKISYACLAPIILFIADLLILMVERILVVLRDGRHLVGVLRSFDQFCKDSSLAKFCFCFLIWPFPANFVLEDTFERHVVENKYGDIPLGLYIIRGENVVLLGEIVSPFFLTTRNTQPTTCIHCRMIKSMQPRNSSVKSLSKKY